MNEITTIIEQYKESEFMALKNYKAEGGKIGAVFNRYFPISLLWGFGIWPLRILSGTTLTAENASEKLIRPDACPFCKSILGNFLLRNSLHQYVDFVVGVICCDQIRRSLERLEEDLSIPIFPLQMPATNSDHAAHYYETSISRVLENLSTYLETTITVDKIRAMESYRYQAAKLLLDLYTRASIKPLILHRLSALFAWTNPQRFLSFLVKNRESLPAFSPKTKVLIIGSIIGEEDTHIVSQLEQYNCFPIILTSNMINAVEGIKNPDTVDNGQLIATLIKNTFHLPQSIRSRPNNNVYNRIKHYIDLYKPSGIILKSLVYCDLWYTEKQRLQETFSLPVLIVNSGYGKGTEGSLNTRIEAFMETLQW